MAVQPVSVRWARSAVRRKRCRSSSSKAWLSAKGEDMKDNLRERLEKHGLSRVAEEIATLAEPAIRFKTSKTLETEIPVGASKLGGKPDLPPAVVLPIWNGTPLSFLLQINLEDLTQYEFASILPL